MTKKILFVAAAVLVGIGAPASAQSIGTARPQIAIAASKAFRDAYQAIGTQYKAQLDQIDARQRQRNQLLIQLDKNNDKQIDDAELEAAKTAKSPVLGQVEAIDKEVDQIQRPILFAQLYVLDQVLQRYEAAQTKVVTDKKLIAVMTPESFLYASPTLDMTQAITGEIDKAFPSAVTTPPANWQPTQQLVTLLQQIQQIQQAVAAQQGRAAPAAAPAAGTAPATPNNKQPQSR